MKFVVHTVPLFVLPEKQIDLSPCMLIPMPKGGKILDLFTIDKTAVLLMQADIDAQIIEGHFHIVPVNSIMYADSFKYIGMCTFDNVYGIEKFIVYIAEIPEGGFGITSQDYDTEQVDIPYVSEITDAKPLSNTDMVSEKDIKRLFGLDTSGV